MIAAKLIIKSHAHPKQSFFIAVHQPNDIRTYYQNYNTGHQPEKVTG